MFNANGQAFDMLGQYPQTIGLDGISLKMVNLEGLLLIKQSWTESTLPIGLSSKVLSQRSEQSGA